MKTPILKYDEYKILISLANRFQGRKVDIWYYNGKGSFLCRVCGRYFKHKDIAVVDHGIQHVKDSNLLPFI
jgi:hypothetical protein